MAFEGKFYGKTVWSEAVSGRFVELFNRGFSFSVIASRLNAEFNELISRNACIGRAHRMGLTRDGRPPAPRKPRNRRRPDMQHKRIFLERPRRNFKCDPVKLSEVNANARHLSITELEHGQCRYPFGDGLITFCGLPAYDGGSYCELHFSVTHKPTLGRSERVYRRDKFGRILQVMEAAA